MIRNRIAVKLGLTIMGLFFFVLFPLGYVIHSIVTDFYDHSMENDAREQAVRYSTMLQSGGEPMIGMLDMMAEMGGVDLVYFDPSGAVLAETDMNDPPRMMAISEEQRQQAQSEGFLHHKFHNDNGDVFLMLAAPVNGNQINGTLGVITPVETARRAAGQIQSLLILAGIGALLTAAGITYIVSRRMSQPLIQMEAAARRMAKGDLDVKVDVISDDETGSLARTLNELGHELKRYRDSRSEFFANISHELRTPITYLEGYSQLLSEGMVESEEDRGKYLQIIRQEAHRLKSLVDDLFELSKMEDGNFTVAKEEIDVSEALQQVLDKLGPRLSAKGLRLERRIRMPAPCVWADGNRVEQIFFNLIDNAIRYTAQGKIQVKLDLEGTDIVTEITDTGEGIPEDELPYVFERFYRVEKSRSREYGGTGLGLAIVKKLVEMQDGRIEVRSVLNEGTTFIVRMPVHAKEGAS